MSAVLALRGDPGLPVGLVTRYLRQVAEALDHVHAHDPPVVHGDMKPANIVVGSDDRAVLVDFGVATSAGEVSSSFGSAGFRSPEAISREPLSPASDVYSLAATAVALLAGRPPSGEVPRWEGVPAFALGTLERAVRTALSLDPRRRPRTATDFVDQLEAWSSRDLPTGTLAFMLTDLEGSTRLWELAPSHAARVLLGVQDLTERCVAELGGHLPNAQGEGDSALAVFVSAADAVRAAVRLRDAVDEETWPDGIKVRVRIGLHSGEAELHGGNYFGSAVHRCGRIRSLAHGGQVLVSQATWDLARDRLRDEIEAVDLGSQRLRDFDRPERCFQVSRPGEAERFPPLRPVSIPSNLPIESSSFVGREGDVAAVTELLVRPDTRLLTLAGPGGIGKSRLAVQVATHVQEEFPDGVWWVALAGIADPEMLASNVAMSLGVAERTGSAMSDSVVSHLKERRALLLLDNFEHLLSAATWVAELAAACPDLKVLVTSRERLNLSGERDYRVVGLALPSVDERDLERILRSSAVALFMERASSADARFVLTDRNAKVVGEICRRLDGLPLAIELAAARVRLMSVEAIRDRLRQSLQFLAGGPRNAPDRHRTLIAAIEWSYGLLTSDEQRAMQDLAVFAGPFSLEAAEAVLDRLDAVDLVAQLVDKSLLQRHERDDDPRFVMLEDIRGVRVPVRSWRRDGDDPRFVMLETLREFSRERLAERDDADEVRERQTLYHLDRLPSYIRTPALLRYFHGLTDREIAIEMEIPTGTVKSRLALARLLAPEMGGWSGLDE